MYYDAREYTYFTYPASDKIDQAEYNKYAKDFYDNLADIVEDKKNSPYYAWRLACVEARMKAEKKNTATSLKFLEDLSLIDSIQEFNEILGFPRY